MQNDVAINVSVAAHPQMVEEMRRIMDEMQAMRHTPGTPYDDIMRRFVDLVEVFVRGLERGE